MRYEIGDFCQQKPVTGVCRIEDILYLDAQGKKDNKLYYRMHPVEDEKETIYVPVEFGLCFETMPNRRRMRGGSRKDPRNFDAMDGEREDAGAEV